MPIFFLFQMPIWNKTIPIQWFSFKFHISDIPCHSYVLLVVVYFHYNQKWFLGVSRVYSVECKGKQKKSGTLMLWLHVCYMMYLFLTVNSIEKNPLPNIFIFIWSIKLLSAWMHKIVLSMHQQHNIPDASITIIW